MPVTPRAILYRRTTPPCKDCTDRQVGCHGKCEKYIKWKKENIKSQIEYTNALKGERAAEDVRIRGAEKYKKRRRGK